MAKYYSANEFSQKIGVSVYTLKKWEKCGELYPHHVLNNRYRYYSEKQLKQVAESLLNKSGLAIGYLRTGDSEYNRNIVNELEIYLSLQYSQYDVMVDEGSSHNKLKILIEQIILKKVRTVIIVMGEYSISDYNLLTMIVKLYDCDMKVINYQDISNHKKGCR